ncbi:MAG: hypothetical protein M2R45_01438 [Verrucomicrobia subdivision 3 bacterium]|nr:hypothetical protein [Limisphaerales bacterium]MCS1417617.1 hypothetical protein [Limisphaerales bacterium]
MPMEHAKAKREIKRAIEVEIPANGLLRSDHNKLDVAIQQRDKSDSETRFNCSLRHSPSQAKSSHCEYRCALPRHSQSSRKKEEDRWTALAEHRDYR